LRKPDPRKQEETGNAGRPHKGDLRRRNSLSLEIVDVIELVIGDKPVGDIKL
jgi:hypothetical protein